MAAGAFDDARVASAFRGPTTRMSADSSPLYLPATALTVSHRLRVVAGLSLGLPREAVGTIHTMQGKEADIVILVLGSSNGGQRVWAAEKPNLLNLAVSRAKRQLYVIGNCDLWKRQQYFYQIATRLPVVAVRPKNEGDDR